MACRASCRLAVGGGGVAHAHSASAPVRPNAMRRRERPSGSEFLFISVLYLGDDGLQTQSATHQCGNSAGSLYAGRCANEHRVLISIMVERKGIEPSTFALRTRRSPN